MIFFKSLYLELPPARLRQGAGTVFIWPWQSAPKHYPSARLFTQPSSRLRFLLDLTSLLFKNPFTFNLNLPESLKQRCISARSRTVANYRCDVSFERPLITSRPSARSYASRERKLWWKTFKIKRFASGFGKIWDSRSTEGKDKLSTDPLTEWRV